MTDKTWKQVERRIAEFFGTVRTPLSGFNSKHTGADIIHEKLFVEVKMRKKIPFYTLFRNTIKLARKENKIPLVVFVEKGSPNPILMCRLHDLKKIAEEQNGKEDSEPIEEKAD